MVVCVEYARGYVIVERVGKEGVLLPMAAGEVVAAELHRSRRRRRSRNRGR